MELNYKTNTIGIANLKYATEGASCFDICSVEDVMVQPGQTQVVGTGLLFEPEEGYGLMLYPRSGISAKTPLRFANGVGVIDNDYRGEVKILVENCRPESPKKHMVPSYQLVDGTVVEGDYQYGFLPEGSILIKRGDRIAQAMPIKIEKAEIKKVKELNRTKRGEVGLGSTGVRE